MVSDDGTKVAVTMLHFSKQALAARSDLRKNFVGGTYCGGESAQAVPIAVCLPTPGPTESGVVGGLGPAEDRPTRATMMDKLVDLSSPAALGDTVVFKNEERAGMSTACDGSYTGKPGFEDEDYFGDPALLGPLRELERLVRTRSCGSLKLLVTETCDTLREHESASRHYEGRAVDLSLIGADPATGAVDCDARRYTFGLGRLAIEAGFGHVEYAAYPSSARSNKILNRNTRGVHASVANAPVDPLARTPSKPKSKSAARTSTCSPPTCSAANDPTEA